MKLAFVSPTYPLRGGIARYGTHLLGAFKKRHDCIGISFEKLYPEGLFPGKGQMELGDLPEEGAAGQPMLHYAKPGTWMRAAEIIEAHSPDAVVLTWWVTFWAFHTGYLARRLSKSFPVFFLCHNVMPHEPRFYDPSLVRWALAPGQGFIVHSEENLEQVKNLPSSKPAKRREHPIYSTGFSENISPDVAKTQLGIKGRCLLFFGFIRHYKGLDIAIEALTHLQSEYDDLILYVAGEFWEEEKTYRDLIEKYKLGDRVIINAGYLSDADLNLRLHACDGVILPYRSATGSGVLSTAYAMNKPVIATRCGCFKEMVKDGQSGLLCEPGDAKGLADTIMEFYAGAGPTKFAGGVTEVRKQFTWDAIIDSVEELLEYQ